jgi:hypothetical protein
VRAATLVALLLATTACPAPRHPTPPVDAFTLAIGRDGASLRGVAGDAARTYAALSIDATTTIEARSGRAIAWTATLEGHGGPIAHAGDLVAVTLGGKRIAGTELRGEPGAMVVALAAATGKVTWKVALDSSEWAHIAAIAGAGNGVIVVGAFSGSLRAGAKTVASGGKSDGFIARIGATGDVMWLVRMGGVGTDAVLGVATAGDRIAIAGTFAPGADILGEPLVAYDDKTPRADGFVAELDAKGTRRWSAAFGGKLDDSVAGVAIDGAGRVAVAASAREVIRLGTTELVTMGDADGAVAWWSKDGVPGPAVQLGGPDFDGVRGIAAVGERVVVGGFFSGTIRLGQQRLTAGGGDDAYLAAFKNGELVELWPVTGEGREEIAALATMPGGFIAGVTHTARASVDNAMLPAPKDPASGAALVVRAVK